MNRVNILIIDSESVALKGRPLFWQILIPSKSFNWRSFSQQNTKSLSVFVPCQSFLTALDQVLLCFCKNVWCFIIAKNLDLGILSPFQWHRLDFLHLIWISRISIISLQSSKVRGALYAFFAPFLLRRCKLQAFFVWGMPGQCQQLSYVARLPRQVQS